MEARHAPHPLALALGIACSLFFVSTVQAGIVTPNSPLQTGTKVPPNIMLMLDDSGSMAETNMDDPTLGNFTGGGLSGSELSTMQLRAYANNSIFYNPAETYLPWRLANGTRMASTPYTAVYTDTSKASGSTTNLTTANQEVYYPINPALETTNAVDYYRYRFKTDGTADRCQRTQVLGVWGWNACVTGITSFTWTTPTGPVTRTLAQEKQNYANWYSYNRTRMKVAKSGASSAFGDLGEDIRVGMRSLWNNSGSSNFNIPVTVDNGLFRNQTTPAVTNNRTNWYNALFSSTANNGTPLRSALRNMGTYYTDTSATGPWGPEATALQIACRQNFTILTTDGYWNGDSGFAEADGDSVSGPVITSPTGATYQYVPGRPYSSATANTLADVSMRYWKNDLRTDLPNIVPPSADDPAFWQHMVTFGVGLGVCGAFNPTNVFNAIKTGSPVPWRNPTTNNQTLLDDLLHAAVNGRGGYFSAQNPTQFATALSDTLNAISQRSSSAASIAANSTQISTNTKVFGAKFDTSSWSGELEAYPITSSGVGTTPTWVASSKIPAPASRSIYTTSGGSGVPFAWGSLSAADQSAIGSADLVDYLRGVRTKEQQNGGELRNRTTILGDIINSSPIYVINSDSIYVGANDGMLHGFNATTGVELFAYIPSAVIPQLGNLAQPGYTHTYFVDGDIAISSTSQTPAHNYLVATLGRGGKGLFGLDVTTPSSFTASNVLWEYFNASDVDLGFMLGAPVIAKMNDGTMAVIVGNGYNSTNGKAVLYILNLTTGALIRKIDTGVSGDNGLGAPGVIDTDKDGDIDYIYAGDLKGNVWKFDVSTATPATWDFSFKAGTTPLPLFVAKDSIGNVQPITVPVVPVTDTIAGDSNYGKRFVFFGTGSYFRSTDSTDKQVQSMYGLIDDNLQISNRTSLVQRTVTANGIVNGKDVRTFSAAVANDMVGKSGWYLDLKPAVGAVEGERVITSADIYQLAEPTLVFSSVIPINDPCKPGGKGFLNGLSPFTGGRLTSGFFDVTQNNSFTDDLLNGVYVGSIDLGIGMPSRGKVVGDQLVVAGSGGGSPGNYIEEVKINTGLKKTRRVSWREIIRD